MGNCRHCGRFAGFLNDWHEDCQEDFERVLLDIFEMAVDAVLDSMKLDGLLDRVKERVSESGFSIPDSEVRRVLAKAWCIAVDRTVERRGYSSNSHLNLNRYRKHLELTSDDVGGAARFDVLGMMGMLKCLSDDATIPRFDHAAYGSRLGRLPFNLLDSEELIWVFQDVTYLKLMTIRNERMFRSDRYVTSMQRADAGTLGISTRHIYFAGFSAVFRVGFETLISTREYRDAVGIVRDTEGARPEAFRMEGPGAWFAIRFIDAIRDLKEISPPCGDSPTLWELMEREE